MLPEKANRVASHQHRNFDARSKLNLIIISKKRECLVQVRDRGQMWLTLVHDWTDRIASISEECKSIFSNTCKNLRSTGENNVVLVSYRKARSSHSARENRLGICPASSKWRKKRQSILILILPDLLSIVFGYTARNVTWVTWVTWVNAVNVKPVCLYVFWDMLKHSLKRQVRQVFNLKIWTKF